MIAHSDTSALPLESRGALQPTQLAFFTTKPTMPPTLGVGIDTHLVCSPTVIMQQLMNC